MPNGRPTKSPTPSAWLSCATATNAPRPSAVLATTPRKKRPASVGGSQRSGTGGGASRGSARSRYGPASAWSTMRCGGAARSAAMNSQWKSGSRKSPDQNGLTPASRRRRADSETPAAMNGSATARSAKR